jgi:hypothetical protein
MKVTIEGNKLSFDLYDLLGAIDDAQRTQIIDTLACRDEVINEVANQIIDGFTTEGNHGPCGLGGNPDATWGIDGARMRIAKASSEIAAREIEQLGAEIKRAKELGDKGWAAYHELLEQRRSFA